MFNCKTDDVGLICPYSEKIIIQGLICTSNKLYFAMFVGFIASATATIELLKRKT